MTTPHQHRREVAEAYDRGHAEGLRDRQEAYNRGWDGALDLAIEALRRHEPDPQRRHELERELIALFSQARHTVRPMVNGGPRNTKERRHE